MSDRKAVPVSVALGKEQRAAFEAEAKRRGLGLSTTIRTLAIERTHEIREQRQRERARRWQTERLRTLIDRIERDGFQEASQADIDAVFAEDRRSSAALVSRRRRRGVSADAPP
jgi:hypothetical protein